MALLFGLYAILVIVAATIFLVLFIAMAAISGYCMLLIIARKIVEYREGWR